MAGVSTPALAAAVSNAGGLGSLGIGASSVAQARAAILQTRELTSRPFDKLEAVGLKAKAEEYVMALHLWREEKI